MNKDSLFKRLQSYTPRLDRNPKEDFFTEAFVYAIQCDPNLLRKYVEFLSSDIEFPWIIEDDDSITIETQIQYDRNRPDVTIQVFDESYNQKFVIICEHKLDANEGDSQLSRYSDVLDNDSCDETKLLVYITKYYESEIEEYEFNIPFNYLRWSDIYNWIDSLSELSEDFLVNQIKKYMEELKMPDVKMIDPFTLTLMNRIPDAGRYVQHILKRGPAWAEFKNVPSPPRTQIQCSDVDYMVSTMSWNYSKYIKDTLRIEFGVALGESEYLKGFEGYPTAYVLIRDHTYKTKRMEYHRSYCTKFFNDELMNEEDWQIVDPSIKEKYYLVASKSLFYFVEDGENQVENIRKWLTDRLREVREYLESNELE